MRSFLLFVIPALALAADTYNLGPDSQRQPGVPIGKVEKFSFDRSKLYPGSTRNYWVYTPTQYNASKPAPFMIFMDGGGWVSDTGGSRGTVVLDNLIAKGDMPPTVGIFVDPGVMPPLDQATQMGRYNRSYEYDAIGDRYARFLIEELIPEVASKVNLSKSPDDHGLGGSSSGGIAAFGAAWERPDYFHRVFSFIGSFTDLRGGDIYPALIRKMEAKPLRVFLQDGDHDQSIYGGSWWLMNQGMASALEFAGYDYKFITGTDGHSGRQGASILPDVLRFLWHGYPAPVKVNASPADPRKPSINTFIDVRKTWEVVSEGHQFTDGPAVDKDGNVYFVDIKEKRIYKADFATNKTSVFKQDNGGIYGLMFGPDGRLYAAQAGKRRVVSYNIADGGEKVLAEDVGANDLCVSAKGDVYVSDPAAHRIWLIPAKGAKRVAYEAKDIAFPNGVRLSPDQSLITVSDTQSKWVWSFQVQPDGTLANGQRFYRMETYDDPVISSADGMTLDTEGFLYVATNMGIQICDQPGRVNGIIANPQPGRSSNLVFAGPDLDWLYVTEGDKVFRRQTKRKGTNAWTLVKLPKPGL